ncbi:hypothetical protein ABK040_005542 [Willaertia magna]
MMNGGRSFQNIMDKDIGQISGVTRNKESRKELLQRLPKPNFLRVKVISMGESETGKSCLIKRYCEEKFHPKYNGTTGVDFGVKKVLIDGKEVRVNFWDLSGQPEFFEVRNEFYKDTQGAILVYDVTSRKTFEALDSWMAESSKYGAKSIVVVVCGNKIDEKNRAVSEKDGRDWATKNGLIFFETSASSGENVQLVFDTLFREVIKNVLNN